jgi:hypothetical protein
MSRTQKEKTETHSDAPLEIITKNAVEKEDATDDYVEVALERRKREVDAPIYLKRI